MNSRLGTGMGLGVSQLVPPWVGYPFANLVADLLAMRQGASFVRAVRANQWVIHNEKCTSQQLDGLVRATFRSTARSLYEFWHLFRSPRAILDMVDFEPSFLDLFHSAQRSDRGTLIVVPHMANFDLIGRAIALRGLNLHILSYPQPPGGYRFQNKVRQIPGLLVTPMSIQALRQASESLRANQTVVTGVDRALPEGEDAKYRPRFFGRPAALPVFYIRLALKHKLPISVLGGCRKPDGRYSVWASEPIAMQRHSDLIQELVENAEAVLAVIAEYIRRAPEQWAMYYPVWPEALETMPGK